VKVEAKVRKKAQIPKLVLPKTFWEQVAVVVSGSILDNIVKQRQADGQPLKKNAPTTLLRKLAHGRGSRSLVDKEHRFVQGSGMSWRATYFYANNAGVRIGPATTQLRDLVRFLAEKGYSGYIGVSQSCRSALKALLKQQLKEMQK
jgi:hypothetical protein